MRTQVQAEGSAEHAAASPATATAMLVLARVAGRRVALLAERA